MTRTLATSGQDSWQRPAVDWRRLTETDWKQRALTAEAALEEARTETARLWTELHQRRADENELAYYRGLYESQVDSVSWKVTRPLRDAKVLAAKVQRKLAER